MVTKTMIIQNEYMKAKVKRGSMHGNKIIGGD
jgi:hypothetical protein